MIENKVFFFVAGNLIEILYDMPMMSMDNASLSEMPVLTISLTGYLACAVIIAFSGAYLCLSAYVERKKPNQSEIDKQVQREEAILPTNLKKQILHLSNVYLSATVTEQFLKRVAAKVVQNINSLLEIVLLFGTIAIRCELIIIMSYLCGNYHYTLKIIVCLLKLMSYQFLRRLILMLRKQ